MDHRTVVEPCSGRLGLPALDRLQVFSQLSVGHFIVSSCSACRGLRLRTVPCGRRRWSAVPGWNRSVAGLGSRSGTRCRSGVVGCPGPWFIPGGSQALAADLPPAASARPCPVASRGAFAPGRNPPFRRTPAAGCTPAVAADRSTFPASLPAVPFPAVRYESLPGALPTPTVRPSGVRLRLRRSRGRPRPGGLCGCAARLSRPRLPAPGPLPAAADALGSGLLVDALSGR